MNHTHSSINLLRKRALAKIGKSHDGQFNSDGDLAHELKLHEIELEMQIDDMHKSQQEMTEALDRNVKRLENIPVPYLILNVQGVVYYSNMAAGQFFGKTRRQLLQRRLQGLLNHDMDKLFLSIKKLYKTRENVSLLTVFKGQDGKNIPLKLCLGLLEETEKDQKDQLCSCVITDMSGTSVSKDGNNDFDAFQPVLIGNGAVLEDRIRQLEKQLIQKEEELDSYSLIANNDLQEPLRMISSFGRMLEQKYQDNLDGEAQEYLNYALEGAERIQQLIYSFLDYTQLGKGNIDVKVVDMGQVVKVAMRYLKRMIKESGAKVHVEELPMVMGEPHQMLILWQHLIANAIKFRKKDVAPEIFIDFREEQESWVYSIRDNGIGFNSRLAKLIFRIFHRLNEREKYSGIGIGLAVCSKITELHGGEIWAESKEGEGSTFYFKLPKHFYKKGKG